MSQTQVLYLCRYCFRVSDTELECHRCCVLRCEVGAPGDEIRKPFTNSRGKIEYRAPRWFVEALRHSG